MNQAELRKKVRLERRVELAKEGLRYMDLVRWRLAEKVFSRPLVGIQQGTDLFKTEIIGTDDEGNGITMVTVKPGLWFWSQVPEIDEDGIADFQPLIDAGTGREPQYNELPGTTVFVSYPCGRNFIGTEPCQ